MSNVTSKIYQVLATSTCKTRNVVYLIQCSKLGKQYVGEMENAVHIKNCYTEKSVATHLPRGSHLMKDLTIMINDKIYRENASHKKKKGS